DLLSLHAGTIARASDSIAANIRKRRTIGKLLTLGWRKRQAAGARFLRETGPAVGVASDVPTGWPELIIRPLDHPVLGAGEVRERERIDAPGVEPSDGAVGHGNVHMLLACMLPAAKTDRFLPAGVPVSVPLQTGKLGLGQMP